jgi:hypothetical protein
MPAGPAKPVLKINVLPANLPFEQPHQRSETIQLLSVEQFHPIILNLRFNLIGYCPSADIGMTKKLTNEF